MRMRCKNGVIGLALTGAACLLLVGSAGAGQITATYDLAGSTIETTSPLGTFSDPLTGTVTIVYQAATEFAAPTSGVVLSGTQDIVISQPSPGLLTLTGTTNTTWGSAPGTISGPTFSQTVGATGNTTGYLHCFGGLCGLAGFTASVPVPQTQTGPITLPPLAFTSGTGGIGNFGGTGTQIVTVPATVTIVSKYTGTEINRVFVPEPGALMMLLSGLAGLSGLAALKSSRSR